MQHCCNSGETSAINYKTWRTKVKQKEKNKAVKQKKRRWGNIKRRNEGETAEIWVFLQQEGETLQREGKAVCSALTHIAQWSEVQELLARAALKQAFTQKESLPNGVFDKLSERKRQGLNLALKIWLWKPKVKGLKEDAHRKMTKCGWQMKGIAWINMWRKGH